MKFEDRKSGGLTSISYRFSVGAALSTAAYWSNVCVFFKKKLSFLEKLFKSPKFRTQKFKVLQFEVQSSTFQVRCFDPTLPANDDFT